MVGEWDGDILLPRDGYGHPFGWNACFSEKKMEAKTLGFPYVYRFSAKDVRVGLTDPEQNHLFLLRLMESCPKDFPLPAIRLFQSSF